MAKKSQITLDHVGWVTNDLQKFEDFWVKILGFKKIWESDLTPEMAKALFGINHQAKCLRYKRSEITVECHIFEKPVTKREIKFRNLGLNHVALYVENRAEFLKLHNFKIHVYHNPKGWDNIFIRDFEGNWIELRGPLGD